MRSVYDLTFLGLDVHKDTISVAVLEPGAETAVLDKISSDGPSVRRPNITAWLTSRSTSGQVRRLRAVLSCDGEQARSGAPVDPAARTMSRSTFGAQRRVAATLR
jgi:hypothetical protein